MSRRGAGVLRLRTPAKLNLGLRLVGLRSDGYHLLESVFAPIDLWDELEIELGPEEGAIELEVGSLAGASLPEPLARVGAGPDNLVYRAAKVFRRHFSLGRSIRIRLEKGIPAAAGLGGGSSDAAAVLKGLALLAENESSPVGIEDLEPLALELGADVPFFLAPGPAHASGIGEQLEPLDDLPGLDLVVANPGISLATAEVYRAADALRSALTPPEPGSTMRAFSRLCREDGGVSGSLGDSVRSEIVRERLGNLLVNDLEPAARRLCPPVARLAEAMREAGAIGVSMSGSGATVFGVFGSAVEAEKGAEALREVGPAGSSVPSWLHVSRLIGRERCADEFFLGRRQMVRQRPLEPPFVGSSPTAPASPGSRAREASSEVDLEAEQEAGTGE